MRAVTLALVSQVDDLSTAELQRVSAVLKKQIRGDFAPIWGVEADIAVFPSAADVPLEAWPIFIRKEIGTPGSAAIHSVQDGRPYALVQFSEGWSLTASHQCLEMLADPYGNRLVSGPSPMSGQGEVQFLIQVCDPCESHEFAYEIDGITVSDFVTPAFYGANESTEGKFDFRGAVSSPLQVLRGGYLSWLEPISGHWWQCVFFGQEPEFKDLGRFETEEGPETEAEEESGAGAEPSLPTEKETPLPADRSRAGRLEGAANDQVAAVDQLGFRDYVTAFVGLIRAPLTRPPITIGIFGSWGVGKSFLLRHIGDELRASAKEVEPLGEGQPRPRVHVVELNAWAYSASEAVWPSLVRRVMECGEREIGWPFPGRFLLKLWRNLLWELHRERGKLIGAVFAGALLLTVFLWRLDFDVSLLGAAVAALGLAGLVKVVADTLANPLSRWVTAVMTSGEYGEDVDYMRRIRHDLEHLSGRLEKENGRIVILIDDLDRCEPEKMVEVLQAVNLLLNFESYIVCLGIDARMVTRAIEKHYEGLLERSGASGYEYLDKIVQIPFRIPRPSDEEIQGFLTTQLREAVGGDRDGIAAESGAGTVAAELPGATTGEVGVAAIAQSTNRRGLEDGAGDEDVAFTEDEIAAFEALAPFLEPNPRHLKRIVNVYRLVRSLATVRKERFVLDDPAGTIRLLTLAAQWPYTLAAMLDRLEDMIEEEAAGAKWPGRDPLEHLYSEVKPSLDVQRQAQLDRELEDLDRLIGEAKGQLAWKALVSLRRYVVNFNPAVEEELRATRLARLGPSAATAANPAQGQRARGSKPRARAASRRASRSSAEGLGSG